MGDVRVAVQRPDLGTVESAVNGQDPLPEGGQGSLDFGRPVVRRASLSLCSRSASVRSCYRNSLTFGVLQHLAAVGEEERNDSVGVDLEDVGVDRQVAKHRVVFVIPLHHPLEIDRAAESTKKARNTHGAANIYP